MSFRFQHSCEVRWNDIDASGVLGNAVFLELLEQTRFHYFKNLDLLLDGVHFPFLLGETSIRFVRPGRAGMTLTIFGQVQQLGDKSFEMVYEIAHDEQVLAHAVATLVWVDRNLESCAIPDEAREKISRFEEIPAHRDSAELKPV